MTGRLENFHDDQSNHGNSDDSQLRLAITVLRKRMWQILFALVGLCAITAVVVWSIPPTYRATATLELEGQSSLINLDDAIASEIAADEYLQTQVELVRTPQLAARVVDELSLTDHWELNSRVPVPDQFKPKNQIAATTEKARRLATNILDKLITKAQSYIPALKTNNPNIDAASLSGISPEDVETIKVIEQVIANSRIFAVKGTNTLFKITYDSRDPVLAAQIANTFGELYIQTNAQSSITKSELANERLTGRLEGLRVALENSEQKILEFMQSNELVDVRGDVQTLSEQEIRSVTDNIIEARREVQANRTLYDQVRNASSQSLSAVALVPSVSGDPSVQISRREVQESQRVLNELSNKYLAKHPKVIDAASNLKTAQQNLEFQAQIVADRIERSYRNSLANLRSLEAQLQNNKSDLQSTAEKRLELDKLQQQAATDRELYEIFADRIRKTNESLGLTPAIASFANLATPPLNPVKPRKALILFTVFALGLIALSMFALSLEEYKDTIQGIHDVERKLKLGVLGVVPKVRSKTIWKKSDGTLIPGSIADPDGRFIESMRTLRTSLKLSSNNKKSNVILVTSSVPEEGKSTVASNLAHAMSISDSTLFIEADLRRPGVLNSLQSDHPGLANLLTDDDCKPSDCIQPSLFGNVDVITAGHISVDSPELLAGDTFAKLIDIFKRQYDWIIIDSAPVQAVSDSLLLGQSADAALFIVRSDSTISSVARRAIQRLQHYKINLLGVVITQVDLEQIYSYGGEHYYQGYIDRYGYGDVRRSNNKASAAQPMGFNPQAEYSM